MQLNGEAEEVALAHGGRRLLVELDATDRTRPWQSGLQWRRLLRVHHLRQQEQQHTIRIDNGGQTDLYCSGNIGATER